MREKNQTMNAVGRARDAGVELDIVFKWALRGTGARTSTPWNAKFSHEQGMWSPERSKSRWIKHRPA